MTQPTIDLEELQTGILLENGITLTNVLCPFGGMLSTFDTTRRSEGFVQGDLKEFLGFDQPNFTKLLVNIMDKTKSGAYSYFLMHHRQSICGIVYLYNINPKYRRASLAYGLLPHARGNGIMISSLREFTDILHSMGFLRISLEIEPENLVGSSLITSNFKGTYLREGVLRSNYGSGIDSIVYASVQDAYLPLQERPYKTRGAWDYMEANGFSTVFTEPPFVNTKVNKRVGGAAVFVIKDGAILVGERADGQGWCIPGGKIDEGELPEETAMRECGEEAGITPINLYHLGISNSRAKVRGKLTDVQSYGYYCTSFQGTPTNTDELSNVQFMKWDDVLKLTDSNQIFQPTMDFIAKFYNELNVAIYAEEVK